MAIERKYNLKVGANGLNYVIEAWGKPLQQESSPQHSHEQNVRWLQETHNDKNKQIKMLHQVHGNHVIQVPFAKKNISAVSPEKENESENKYVWGEGDALFTTEKNIFCAIRTADCIPILVYSLEKPMCVGIHAGWRGLQNNIVPKTIEQLCKQFSLSARNLKVFVGAHIHAESYPVKEDVFSLFAEKFSYSSPAADTRNLDTTKILLEQLLEVGIAQENCLFVADNCYQSKDWFSHRNGESGRNIFLIFRE